MKRKTFFILISICLILPGFVFGQNLLIKNATVMTAIKGTMANTDIFGQKWQDNADRKKT